MSDLLPMELMWVSFPTQTPRNLLPAERQRVQIIPDHGCGGLQLRSITGELVGWVDPLDDARAMRVLKFLETLGKGGRVGGIVKQVTVGWPSSGPRLQPAEGNMTMRLLKQGEGVFDNEKAAAKAKVKALSKGKMAVKSGTTLKTQKGVAGGRVAKKTKAKPKLAVPVADTGKKERNEKDKKIPAIPTVCKEEEK
ncbi:hypothetical protein EDC01DRAFT_784296 [Geopyxis carbonaria]|nr:hypothetical protein EDC01DRAFT_784296 [Geopyxis carbonaria]